MSNYSRFFFADVGNWLTSRILCLDLDSSRTGAFGNEVDVVQVHTLYISRLFKKRRILIDWEILALDQNGDGIALAPQVLAEPCPTHVTEKLEVASLLGSSRSLWLLSQSPPW